MFYNNSLTQIRIVPIYTVQICSLVSREYIFATHGVIKYIRKKFEPKAINPTCILYCTRLNVLQIVRQVQLGHLETTLQKINDNYYTM